MQEEINYAATSSVKGIVSPQLILLAYSTSYLSGIYVIYFPEKNEFVFNTYKTSKFYGEQRIEIPKELKTILTKWLKVNGTDYLLFDINGSKLTSVKINQRLEKIFGKKAGANLLRHLYLTSKFGDTIKKNNEIDETMEDMGSSASQLKTYVKND